MNDMPPASFLDFMAFLVLINYSTSLIYPTITKDIHTSSLLCLWGRVPNITTIYEGASFVPLGTLLSLIDAIL